MAANDEIYQKMRDLAKLRSTEYLTEKRIAKSKVLLLDKIKVNHEESTVNIEDIEEVQKELRSLSTTRSSDLTEKDKALAAEMKENIRQVKILKKLKNSRLYYLLDEL